MTREKAKELLPVIQAYAEGKPIQYWCDGRWCDGAQTFDANWSWRVKPQLREFWIVREPASEWKAVHSTKPIETLIPGAEIIHVREVL